MNVYSAISAYSRRSRLTFKVLLHLVAKGAISPALTEADRSFLDRLEKIWLDRMVLRSQLTRLSQAKRLALLATADCDTKWERYVFSRLQKALANDRSVTLAKLVEEIRKRFGFTPTESQMRDIRRIRNRIYAERHRMRQAGRTWDEIVG